MSDYAGRFDLAKFYSDALPINQYTQEFVDAAVEQKFGGMCEEARWHTANCPPFENVTLEVEEL